MDLVTRENLAYIESNNIKLTDRGLFKSYVYSKAYYDIDFFSTYFLNHIKRNKSWKFVETPDFHKEIWDRMVDWDSIEKWEAENLYHQNIIVARWHWKTTSIRIYMLWRALYFWAGQSWSQGWNLIYIANGRLWEEWIWFVRKELETNQLIKDVFWVLVPIESWNSRDRSLNKWRQKEIHLLNWVRMSTSSKWQLIRWQRPHEIIIDDLEEWSETLEQFKKNETWLTTSVMWTLLEWCRVCVLWTIVSENCLVKKLRDEYKWLTVEYEACDENFGNVLWPEMHSAKKLKMDRDWWRVYAWNWLNKKISYQKWMWIDKFNQEYRNIPLSTWDRIIRDHWILRYTTKVNYDFTVMAVDPAVTTKETSDSTWITIISLKKENNWDFSYYTRYSISIKLTPVELEKFIVELNKKFQPNLIVYEKNIEVKLLQDLKARWLPIKWIRAHKDKRSRLLEVANLLESWKVFFRDINIEWREDPMMNLIYQLTHFPDLAHDDEMDSFVYALKACTEEQEDLSSWTVSVSAFMA